MSPHYWISVIGIAEATSPRRVRRQRICFAAWYGRKLLQRYSMLPIYIAPPVAFFLLLQSFPDLKGWADYGGFALFAVYMVYRHEKLMREGHERETKLITALEANAQLHGRLLGGIEALAKSVDKLGSL